MTLTVTSTKLEQHIQQQQQPDTQILAAIGLSWLAEWRILLCVKCRSSVTFNNLKRHWSDYQCAHPAASFEFVVQAMHGVVPLSLSTAPKPHPHAQPIKALPVYEGMRCLTCDYVCATTHSVTKHIQVEHSSGDMCPATLQRWNQATASSYFEVQRSIRNERLSQHVAALPPPPPAPKATSSINLSAKRISLGDIGGTSSRIPLSSVAMRLPTNSRTGGKSNRGEADVRRMISRQIDRLQLKSVIRGHNTRHHMKLASSIKKFADMELDPEWRKLKRNALAVHRVGQAPKKCALADTIKLVRLTKKRSGRPTIKPELTVDSVMPARDDAPLSCARLSLVVPLERENEGDATFSWKGPQSWAATISELESRETISLPINPLLSSAPKPMLHFDFNVAPKPKRLDKDLLRARARGAIRKFEAIEVEAPVQVDDGFARFSTYRDVPVVPGPAERTRVYGESLYAYKNKQMRRGISPALPLSMLTPTALSVSLGLSTHPSVHSSWQNQSYCDPTLDVGSSDFVPQSSPDALPVVRSVQLAPASPLTPSRSKEKEKRVFFSASSSPLSDISPSDSSLTPPPTPDGKGIAVAPSGASASAIWPRQLDDANEPLSDARRPASSSSSAQRLSASKAPLPKAAQPLYDGRVEPSTLSMTGDQIARSLHLALTGHRAAPRRQRGLIVASPALMKRTAERSAFSPRKRADLKAAAAGQSSSPLKVHFTPGSVS